MEWRRRCSVIAWLAGLALCASAHGQQTFRTATRLVEVSVVVTTKSGRPVTGLTQADFTLTEDGKVQPVSFFHVNRDNSAMPTRDESLFMVPDTPSTFSNVTPARAGASTVLLLDRTNAAFESQWFARKHIDRYLERMRPGDRVALYVLDGTILVLQDFTGSASLLKQALERYHARETGDYAASNEPFAPTAGRVPWLSDPAGAMLDFFTQKRRIETLELLELLAGHLAGIAGRKNLVWVSEAFVIPEASSLDRLEVVEKLRKAHHALAHAQVSVYPIDSRGLMGAYSVAGRHVAFNNLSSVRGNIETMEIIAEETGGRVFANTNALDRSISSAVDDSRTSYVIGYYPPAGSTGGGFHRIDVKVNRKDVRVRHRSGYFTASAAGKDTDSGKAVARKALEGPLQATGISLSAEAERNGDEVTFSMSIDPATLSLTRSEGRWLGEVELLIAQVNNVGQGVVDVTVPVTVSLTDAQRADALKAGIPLARTITSKPGAMDFRIVARDTTTGKVGSLVIPASRVK